MPLWLITHWQKIAVVLLVLGAVWFIHHDGYKRADDKAKLDKAMEARITAEIALQVSQQRSEFERKMQQIVGQFDARLAQRLNDLDVVEKTIVQPTLVKEIKSAPHLSDPAYGITDGMLRVLNTARASSWPSGACVTGSDGSATCRLPAARPVERPDDSNAGK